MREKSWTILLYRNPFSYLACWIQSIGSFKDVKRHSNCLSNEKNLEFCANSLKWRFCLLMKMGYLARNSPSLCITVEKLPKLGITRLVLCDLSKHVFRRLRVPFWDTAWVTFASWKCCFRCDECTHCLPYTACFLPCHLLVAAFHLVQDKHGDVIYIWSERGGNYWYLLQPCKIVFSCCWSLGHWCFWTRQQAWQLPC